MPEPQLEVVGFALLLAGALVLAAGYLWLVIKAFGTGTLWGIGTFLLAPPGGLLYAVLHFRRALGPLVVMLLGGAVMASPVVINKLLPENREALTEVKPDGETRGTLTGAAETDAAKYLKEHQGDAVLQMANRPDVTDDVILSHVKTMPNLRELDLNDTPVTDKALEALAEMPNLESLRVARTKATADGVEKHILSSKTIKEIDVGGLNVPSKKLRDWKNADPSNRKYTN